MEGVQRSTRSYAWVDGEYRLTGVYAGEIDAAHRAARSFRLLRPASCSYTTARTGSCSRPVDDSVPRRGLGVLSAGVKAGPVPHSLFYTFPPP